MRVLFPVSSVTSKSREGVVTEDNTEQSTLQLRLVTVKIQSGSDDIDVGVVPKDILYIDSELANAVPELPR